MHMKVQPPDASRRHFITASVASLPTFAAFAGATHAAEPSSVPPQSRPLRVVCVGAHPDDPESGCGGTLARYSAAGHRVTVVYLTRGEAGIIGKSREQAATIRAAEAEEACKILGTKPVFAGQIDGATTVSRERAEELRKILAALEPDVVFTHWPLDSHADHQAAAMLTLQSYMKLSRGFALYFFEVNSGSQTFGFVPVAYVDITATREKKRSALFAHRSQGGERIYRTHHEPMEIFRGRELGVAAAEAFVSVARNSGAGRLPGLS
jgi:LmbE family N-acetylglucosaminyl deacetylase